MIWVSCGKRCLFLIKTVLNGGIRAISFWKKNVWNQGLCWLKPCYPGTPCISKRSRVAPYSEIYNNCWSHMLLTDQNFISFLNIWAISISSAFQNFRSEIYLHTSHCLDLDLKGLLTRRKFWRIPGMLENYTIPN